MHWRWTTPGPIDMLVIIRENLCKLGSWWRAMAAAFNLRQ
jgi:hypothetical protein